MTTDCKKQILIRLGIFFALLVGVACTGSIGCGQADPAAIKLNVSGLEAGEQVVFQIYKDTLNNVSDTVTATIDGEITLSSGYTAQAVILVSEQPGSGRCAVAVPFVEEVSEVVTINVVCSTTTYSLAGTVTGLRSGSSIVVAINRDELKTISANGAFTTDTLFPEGGGYELSMATSPDGQYCTFSSGSGTVNADVNVTITCQNTHILFSSESFDARTDFGSRTIADAKCTEYLNSIDNPLSCGGGLIALISMNQDDEVRDIPTNYDLDTTIPIHAKTFKTISENMRGPGVYDKIADNWEDFLDGTIDTRLRLTTFWTGSTDDGALNGNCHNWTDADLSSSYVRMSALPIILTGNRWSNTVSGCGGVASFGCLCSPPHTYTISGTVSGLSSGTLTLALNSTTETLALTANGAFSLTTQIPEDTTYAVTVSSNPSSLTCTVTNGSGTITANVTNVTVTCNTVAHFLFPTSSAIAANFGDRTAANTLCQTEHDTNYTDLTCSGVVAFLSYSGADEIADFPTLYSLDTSLSVLDANNDNTKIADDWTDLVDGTIDNGLTVTWWSGTYFVDYLSEFGDSNGFDCSDYTSVVTAGAAVGRVGETTAFWGGTSTSGNCDETHRVMCLCYQE